MSIKQVDETMRCHQIPTGLTPKEAAEVLYENIRDWEYKLAEFPRNPKVWMRLPWKDHGS
jgi:hypothetical protein